MGGYYDDIFGWIGFHIFSELLGGMQVWDYRMLLTFSTTHIIYCRVKNTALILLFWNAFIWNAFVKLILAGALILLVVAILIVVLHWVDSVHVVISREHVYGLRYRDRWLWQLLRDRSADRVKVIGSARLNKLKRHHYIDISTHWISSILFGILLFSFWVGLSGPLLVGKWVS